jgi:hypothetical protein
VAPTIVTMESGHSTDSKIGSGSDSEERLKSPRVVMNVAESTSTRSSRRNSSETIPWSLPLPEGWRAYKHVSTGTPLSPHFRCVSGPPSTSVFVSVLAWPQIAYFITTKCEA